MTDNRKRLSLRVSPELYARIEEARWQARAKSENDFLCRLIEHALNTPMAPPPEKSGGTT